MALGINGFHGFYDLAGSNKFHGDLPVALLASLAFMALMDPSRSHISVARMAPMDIDAKGSNGFYGFDGLNAFHGFMAPIVFYGLMVANNSHGSHGSGGSSASG